MQGVGNNLKQLSMTKTIANIIKRDGYTVFRISEESFVLMKNRGFLKDFGSPSYEIFLELEVKREYFE